MQRTAHWSIAAGFLCLVVAAAPAARADPDATVPTKASEKILADLSRADLDTAATDASKYMGSDTTDSFKNNFAAIKNLGQEQYTDLVYSRDYGQNEKDMIYKIDFDKAFAYVRFVWHVDGGNWRLIHLEYKTENELPLPAGWLHIYPK